jgi:NTE family protein
MNTENRPYKFGIALSGGGARGILHIGVLEALRKYGIHPEVVSGTSMGALVGAFYASGMEPLQILDLVKSSKLHRMINWKIPANGLLDLKKLLPILQKYIPEDDFACLKTPFCCTVTNLNSGQMEVKSSGQLFQWILASASIPVIFEPQVIDGTTYVDGGLFSSLPAKCIRNQCRFLIGVHVNRNDPEENIQGFKAIAERSFRLVFAKNVNESFALCDFIIDPPQTRLFNTFDFGKADEIYRIGFDETEQKIAELFKLSNLDNKSKDELLQSRN